MKFPTDYLGYANELPKDDKRLSRYKQQREQRGWDDTELWSLDTTILKFIVSRLRPFADNLHSYHPDFTMGQWQDLLHTMADDFEYCLEHRDDIFTKESRKEF